MSDFLKKIPGEAEMLAKAEIPTFQSLDDNLLPAEDMRRLEEFYLFCLRNKYFNIGYPSSGDFYTPELEKFHQIQLNNCGDWRAKSNYILNSFDFEEEVIRFFSDEIFKMPKGKGWGYVSNGGTEGNNFGLWIGRQKFPEGQLYFSKESHYSIGKLAHILRMEPNVIPCDERGVIKYEALIDAIKKNQDKHPIIMANIGTTVKGAIDDIGIIQKLMAEAGYDRGDYYIHADEALSGMVLPFVDDPQPFRFTDGVQSLSVSGHKNIGTPAPSGIAIAYEEDVARISGEAEYVATHDRTVSGSRNGHHVLDLWVFIRKHSLEYMRARVQMQLALVKYVVEQLNKNGIPAWTNKNSITAVFPAPSEAVWRKFGLATATSEGVSHFIATAHQRSVYQADALVREVTEDMKKHKRI